MEFCLPDEAFRGESGQFLETELLPGWVDISKDPVEANAAKDTHQTSTCDF